MTPEELEAKWLARMQMANSRDEPLYVTQEEFGELCNTPPGSREWRPGEELSHLFWGTPVLIDAEKREAQVHHDTH